MEFWSSFGNRDQPYGKRVQIMQVMEFECHITKGYVYRLIIVNTGIVAVIHFSTFQSLDALNIVQYCLLQARSREYE